MKLRVLLSTLLCAFTLLPLSTIKASDDTAQEQSHATLTPAAQNAIAQSESQANAPLYGYTAASSPIERDWENKLRAIPDPKILRDTMQRLSARPHHVGSPYDKQNAEWILSQFKSWGLDAQIETFNVLFPTPKERDAGTCCSHTLHGQAAGTAGSGRSHIQPDQRAAALLQRLLHRW